ncbi:sensor histidine kinase [Planococcus sp. S3-L1]|uniref:sensor histidine kinase n=1 Tax=Planococcus sp. S3-L1 TaxID=3046200 RepID=UPI0024BBA82E|nr:sensor histidine kinase [Planococcus sp. S3-L1]MDJ0332927.1 histidine kinase N-terminal domain-containing protein [Planococcus sp. S3-L1]
MEWKILLSISQLEDLCVSSTNLTKEDIDVLKKTASTLQIYADLSESYMFIDCKMKHSENAIVVAEAFPTTSNPLYENSVVGKIVFESFEPGVFYSYRKGKKSAIRKALTQEGKSVEQSVMPISNGADEVIGVIIQEKEIPSFLMLNNDSQSFSLNSQSFEEVLGENNRGLPLVSDLLMEIFLLTDAENRLVYVNPVGVQFIVEMSKEEKFKDKNLLDFLPFLQPVFEQEEDVFVFELTLDHKNLVVKKVRLREKGKIKGTLLIIQDLTELRMKEKELMMKSLVIQEIHHRVKNNLQTIASLIRLQMRKGIPLESKVYFEDTLNRVFSISTVYELILANENVDQDDVDIIKLVEKIASTIIVNENDKKIRLQIIANGNKILFPSKKAVSISLIINELVQNSVKHAFPVDDVGEIIVSFSSDEKNLELQISDNGVGIKKLKPSLGLEIVENLVQHDLNGEFQYLPTRRGTLAAIQFPISPEVIIDYEKKDFNSRR